MKVKKQKRHRRAERFYTACFGFREPFKILCDGTFVHHLLTNGITPADTALANILGASVKIFTTRSSPHNLSITGKIFSLFYLHKSYIDVVTAELKSLGSSYYDSHDVARNLITARCDHEKRKSAVACITEVIGEKNPEHFFVATQDAELRNKFHQIPGVPAIYALRNALFLERPSTFQQEFVKAAEERRSHLGDLEYKILKKKRVGVGTDEARDSSDANENKILETQDLKSYSKRKGTVTKDSIKFKRNKAKGPNPLSCKKKRIQGSADAASRKESGVDDSTRSRSSKRKSTTEPIV
ncbi:hypothetical protein ACS0TY_003728 [Phlomoides rotata]